MVKADEINPNRPIGHKPHKGAVVGEQNTRALLTLLPRAAKLIHQCCCRADWANVVLDGYESGEPIPELHMPSTLVPLTEDIIQQLLRLRAKLIVVNRNLGERIVNLDPPC